MRNRSIFLTLVALLVSVFVGASAKQISQGSTKNQHLPTVQQVMTQYVDAIGGHDAIFRHKSMTVHGELKIPQQNTKLHWTAYYKGEKMLYEVTLPKGGIYQEGFDGTVAWQMQTGHPPKILEGDELKSRERDADMYYPGHELDYFRTMDVAEVTEFEGHTCYHLTGTNKWGKVNEHFYDRTTGLLIGYRFNSAWRGGSGDEIQVFSDYKSFDGWLMPTRTVNKSANGVQVQTTALISFDNVGDSVFALPDAIKSLVAGKK